MRPSACLPSRLSQLKMFRPLPGVFIAITIGMLLCAMPPSISAAGGGVQMNQTLYQILKDTPNLSTMAAMMEKAGD